MSGRKIAFFFGGPLDGQRHEMTKLPPEHQVMVAERVQIPRLSGRIVDEHRVCRAIYRSFGPTINPRHLSDSCDAGTIDAEIAVYHYMRSVRP